jgi:hypothetical protein
MMKKNSIKGYLILGIMFALVSIIAFAVPTAKTTTFWIAYVFTAAAFAAQIGIWKVALGKEETLKSKFLGFPVVHVGIVYLIVQTVVFAAFMAVPTLPVWSAIVVCALVLGISAICMISAEAGRNEIERVEAKVQKKVFYIRELQVDVELLAEREVDVNVKAALFQLAEQIRFSDPMSNDILTDIEVAISDKVTELKTAENKLSVINTLNALIAERNKKTKMFK